MILYSRIGLFSYGINYFFLLFSSVLIHCRSVWISASLLSILVISISSVFFSKFFILLLRLAQVVPIPKINTTMLIIVDGLVIHSYKFSIIFRSYHLKRSLISLLLNPPPRIECPFVKNRRIQSQLLHWKIID